MIRNFPIEALIWMAGLALLLIGQTGLSICPLDNLGFEHCPGCGLGRSITLFLHGRFTESIATHPLGIFAVGVLSIRIFRLTKTYIRTYGKSY